MKIINLTFGLSCVLFLSQIASANLPVSALTSMKATIYGVYTTSDPTCQTGLTATLPLSKTATAVDFVNNPTLGQGALANPTKCIVLVMSNSTGPTTWVAGTYTGTSTSGGGTYSDNIAACNNGGTQAAGSICRSPLQPTWPTQIKTDAAAAGLSLTTSVCAGNATEVIPVYLSIYSGCTSSQDAGCSNYSSFNPPTTSGDLQNGNTLTTPGTGTIYRFVMDFSKSMGATSSSQCGSFSAPKFSFKTVQ